MEMDGKRGGEMDGEMETKIMNEMEIKCELVYRLNNNP